MDSDVAIRAEGLGKKYLIGHQLAERGATLRDTVMRGVGEFARMGKAMLRGQQIVSGDDVEEFWALRDLDFEIRRGDVVGVIGRNGAGKSTLLKVLSRITEPTEGRVQINGRVASLLEVGTGFHPELSGRENIFLNGAILGMTRAEIRRKFDEIVAFSEVEKFLDTPVKRYSSGMYVRLAFAVAAHLEPEILIVDEVLAVGDAEFQKKCLGKMQDVAGEGRTVIFVSHNMAAISRLCRSAIYISGGQATPFLNVESAQNHYLRSEQSIDEWFAPEDFSSECFTPLHFWFEAPATLKIYGILTDTPVELVIAIRVTNPLGDDIFWTTHRDLEHAPVLERGHVEFSVQMPEYIQFGEFNAEIIVFIHNVKYVISADSGPKINFSVPISSRGSEFFDAGRKGVIQPLIPWVCRALG